MRYLVGSYLVVFITLLFSGNIVNAEYRSSGQITLRREHGMIDLSFSNHDRELIREYFHYKSRYRQHPPGLSKKSKIPPGHQKKYRRHDHLPRNFMYQRSTYQRLPHELERRLSRLPNGCFRVVIGGSVILFDERTQLILDVIHELD